MNADAEPRPEALDPKAAAALTAKLRANVERALRGKPRVVERAVETLISGGHLLLEDVPGVGKTTLAAALARSVDGVLPAHPVHERPAPERRGRRGACPRPRTAARPARSSSSPGPLFAHVVLADEINRASPKTQSALLEAMAEAAVTVDGRTHALPAPVLRGGDAESARAPRHEPAARVAARPLPDAALDRLPGGRGRGRGAARGPLHYRAARARRRCSRPRDVLRLRASTERIKFDDALIAYLIAIVHETREHEAIHLGASTRAALALRRAAQAHALLDERDYAIPEDVRELAVDVLAHRIAVDPRAGAERGGEEAQWLLREILDRVPVPL